MSTESNNNLSREAPQWMGDMFEGLFPDADKLNLEEMQRRLDEQAGSNTRLPLQQC
jgi:hypothetical protein